MNSVASPLRMNMTTAPIHHQPRHPSSASAAASGVRHARSAARAYPTGPVAADPRVQYARAQPYGDDVLAKAHAIALAQAQIQAQVQGYSSQRPTGARNPNYRPRFRSSSGSNVIPTTTSSNQPVEQVTARPSRRGDARVRAESAEQTLHQFHVSSASTDRRTGGQQQPQRITSNCRTSTAGAANYAKSKNASSSSRKPATSSSSSSSSSTSTRSTAAASTARPTATTQRSSGSSTSSSASTATKQQSHQRVEWRVAVDPKSKRPYYYHPITRETTWKKPAELVEKEKREKAQFFSAMENNIRLKLRDGRWLRDSAGSLGGFTPNQATEEERQSSSSTTSTASSSRSSLESSSMNNSSSSAMKMMIKTGAAGFMATRSLPTTPDFVGGGRRAPGIPSDNQLDDETEELSSKRPTLFRTLSSYETPVMTEMKRSEDGARLAVPSPIQERVRLGKLAPRASDLESYARSSNMDSRRPAAPTGSPQVSPSGSSSSSPTMRARSRRRSNSTGTIYVRMGTMNAPDQDCTIQCVATVLRAHMMEALDAPITVDPRFNVFVNRRDLRLGAISDDDDHENNNEAHRGSEEDAAASIPTLVEIAAFIKHVFSRAQMESECIIMSLIYVERLLKSTSGSLQLQGKNWRRILFCSMVMASKVWDDLSMCNADFSKIWPELSLKQINELELVYLSAVEYKVRVSAVSYAKYYFHLRSMCASMGMLESFDESAPLNLDGARKMQVLSEEYQERSKLMPAPRRRSVTITTTSSAEGLQAIGDGKPSSTTKASPAASLEQLVQMQVRPAGGVSALPSSSLSMYRLSSLSKQA